MSVGIDRKRRRPDSGGATESQGNMSEGRMATIANVQLVSISQVAEMLGVSERSVRRLTEDGVIAHVRLSGKLIRYRLSDVENALGRLRIPARSEVRSQSHR